MSNQKGAGSLAISSDKQPLEVSFSEYDLMQMTHSKQDHELQKANFVRFNIDHIQAGVGGDNSWSRATHKEHQLLKKDYAYEFVLKPFANENEFKAIVDMMSYESLKLKK